MDNQIREFSKRNNRKRMLKRMVCLLCVVVLLFTMNTLKRSANTLERIPMCGLIEHIHGSGCYNDAGELVCGLPEHEHNDACYQQSPTSGGTMDNLDINIDGYDNGADQSDAGDAQNLDLSLDLSQGDLLDFVQDPGNQAPRSQAPANNDLQIGDVGLIEEPAPVVSNNAASDGQEVEVEFEDDTRSNAKQSEDANEKAKDQPAETKQEEPVEINNNIKEETEKPVDTEKAQDKPAETKEDKTEAETVEPAATTEEEQEQPAETKEDKTEDKTEAPAATEEEQEQPAETKEGETEAPATTEEEQEQPTETKEGETEAPATTEEEQEQPTETKEGETEAPVTTEEEQEQPAETKESETEAPAATEEEQEQPGETKEGETEAPEATGEEQEQPTETKEGETEAPATTEEEQEQPTETKEGETEAPEATEEEQEQPAETKEGETEAPATTEEEQEQPGETEGDKTEEDGTEAPEATEEEQEQADAESPAAERRYTATVDCAEVESYPISLRGVIANATPAEDYEDVTEAAEEKPVDEWSIEFDSGLFEIETTEDDVLLTPVADFESTDIIISNGSRYELALVNCTLEQPEEAPQTEAEAQVALPPQHFEESTAYMNVVVDAPEGAFPEGTVMVVKDVEDENTIRNIEQSVAGDFVEVTSVHAVDISFWYNDTEIEPLQPIAVVMSAVEADVKSEAPVVVHVADDGETNIVDSESIGATEASMEMPATENPEAQAFEAESFSIYAIVGTQTLVKNYIDDSGNTWSIKVGYTEQAGLPEGASLKVDEVEDSENYLAEAEATLEEGKRIAKARFFDIRILDTEGNEVQPKEAVQVTITLLGDEGTVEAGAEQTDVGTPEALAMHFVERNDEIVKVVSKNATESGDSVTFSAEGFSTWGVVYTVDFTYVDEQGKEHFWQFQGTGSHKISEVLAALGIEAEEISAVDLERTKIVGEFGEKDLYLSQDKETGEWYINSDAAFDDTYELTVVAGGETYVITVTDAAVLHTLVVENGVDLKTEKTVYAVIEQTVDVYVNDNYRYDDVRYYYQSVNKNAGTTTITATEFFDSNGRATSLNPKDILKGYSAFLATYVHGNSLNGYGDLLYGNSTIYRNDSSIFENSVVIQTSDDTTTITIGDVGPVDYTASINFYDAWSDEPDSSVNLVPSVTLTATTADSVVYTASITGNSDPINFTNTSSVTASTINTAGAITWTLNGTTLTEENSVTIGDGYVVSAPTKSGTNYTFEARKPNTYTASLTFKGDSGVAETPSSLGDNYYLVVNDAIYAPVTTSGLGTWVGVTDDKLPEITSFKFVQATGPVSSVSDLTELTALDRIGDYDIVTSTVPTPDSSHSYAFEAAKPIICTASITVDGASNLTDGDYYIVATKDSADVGYYKVGATAENIGFTAFVGGTVALDTDTTFRVVKLATDAATSAEAFAAAAATNVATYSGAKIGENRYTWALDEGTHNYAFSVAPDTLPAGTLRQVIVNLYCHDGTTRVDDSAATADAQEGLKNTNKKMVIVARLEDKSAAKDDPARIIGFQAVGKDFDGHGHYDGIYFTDTFTGLAYPQNANAYNYASDVTYDSEKHDISIRMYVVDSGFNIGTVDSSVYNNLRSQAEAPEGYAFKSEPNGNVTSGATTTLNLQKALSTKYQVKVQFEEATAMPDNQKIFLYVEAQHATSGIDQFGGAVVSSTPVTELTYVLYDPSQNPASGWTLNNGGKFTGNETVQYALYFLKKGTTMNVEQVHIDASSYLKIEEGGYVYGNTVSYTKQRTIEEIDNQNVITDYIVLTRVPTDSEYNFRTILGNGLYFGITANQLTQANDLQTNFACNTFIHEDHSVTPNLSGSSSGTFYIGEVTGSQVQINSAGNDTTCTIYVGEESKNLIKPGSNVIVMPTNKANIGNIVNPILTHAKAVSDDMASHDPTMNIVVPEDVNEFVLDTRIFPEDATIYIDGDDAGLQRILGITDGLKIWKHENQVIVFNFKTTKSVTSCQYKINGVSSSTQTSQSAENGANAGSDRLARGVVWNMNTNGGKFSAGTTLGIILAPNSGTVDVSEKSGSSGAGWIIANTVKNWNGEWHNIYADMPAVNKAIINAKKTVNNRNAKGREKFLFKLERYNKSNQWEDVKAGVQQNHGSAIEFANVDVNDAEHDCWTIYKITETAVVPTIDRADAYTTTDKVYYAAVYSDYVQAEAGQGTSGNVIYPTQYYESFSEAAYTEAIGAPDYVPDKDSAPGVSSPITQTVPVFNNLYNTEDEDGLVVTKMMEGRSLTSGDVFTFTLKGTATTKNGKTITVDQTKTNDATGKVRFDDLKFALNATEEQRESGYYELEVGDFDENYEFTMQLTLAEVITNLHPSVQAKTDPKTLTVTVKRDELENPTANEVLDVTISPKNSELVFTNKYDAEGTAEITAKKAENSALGDKTFQFQLLQEDGTTVIETSTEVKQGETATFPALNYQLSDLDGQTSKDFTYKVKEVIPDDAEDVGGTKVKDGVTYDTTVHTVVVRMTDDGQGNLTPSYKVDGETEFSATLTTPTFSNTYTATGSVDFKATKRFEHGTLTANQFTFKLIQVTEGGSETPVNDPIAEAQTVSNAQDGSVNFTPIQFTLEHTNGSKGTYYFLMKEEVPQGVDANNIKDGIKYDTSKIWYKVEVTDAGDGSLDVKKYRKNGENWDVVTGSDPDASFVNEQLISVGVEKNWKDESGNQFRPSGVSVTLEMKRYSRAVNSAEWRGPADEDETHTVVITINATGTGWTRTVDDVAEPEKAFSSNPGGAGYAAEYDDAMSYTWHNLPKTNQDGTVEYGYRVTETECTFGYHQAQNDSSEHFTESGVQDINNVKYSTVSLPATGGVGTGVVYGAGAAVILLALLGLVLMNRKRGRGTGI